jgi:hypothetical protein
MAAVPPSEVRDALLQGLFSRTSESHGHKQNLRFWCRRSEVPGTNSPLAIRDFRSAAPAANQWSTEAHFRLIAPPEGKCGREPDPLETPRQINISWKISPARAALPCKNPQPPSRGGNVERWPSGLRRTLGKRVCGKLYRGFESHSLRHLHDFVRQTTIFYYVVLSAVADGPSARLALAGKRRDVEASRSNRGLRMRWRIGSSWCKKYCLSALAFTDRIETAQAKQDSKSFRAPL